MSDRTHLDRKVKNRAQPETSDNTTQVTLFGSRCTVTQNNFVKSFLDVKSMGAAGVSKIEYFVKSGTDCLGVTRRDAKGFALFANRKDPLSAFSGLCLTNDEYLALVATVTEFEKALE